MALSVNNNAQALNTYRNLTTTQGNVSKSLEKLSSGFRINRAADDAAGLAISEGLRSQVNGLTQASRNAQDGISVVQTAEGALSETTSILQRMRTLTVQASSDGGLNADAKANIQSEVDQLKSELTRISDTTSFNGTKLLDGKYSGKFQVGANVGESITVAVGTAMGTTGLDLDGLNVTSAAAGLTTATASTAAASGTAGSFTIVTSLTSSENFAKLDGTITMGSKSLNLSSIQYKDTDTVASKLDTLNAALDAAFGTAAGIGAVATGISISGAVPATTADVAKNVVTFTQATGADKGLEKLDTAIKNVSTQRANLGAVQNRLEHTINNLNVATENLTASESRIRDTDMASEMVNFSSKQILAQAGTAMLAQAKNLPQSILSLLQG